MVPVCGIIVGSARLKEDISEFRQNYYRRFSTRSYIGEGIDYLMEMQILVDDLAKLIKRSITLEDINGNLIAYSAHEHPVDQVRVETLLRKGASKSTIEALKKHGVYDKVDSSRGIVHVEAIPEIGFTSRIAIAIRCGRNVLGYLWVNDGERSIMPQDEAAIIQTARMIARNFPKGDLELEISEPETRLVALELISSPGRSDLGELKDKCKGTRFISPFQVLVLRHRSPRASTSTRGLLEIVEDFVQRNELNAICCDYKDEVAILMFGEPWHRVRQIAFGLSRFLTAHGFREFLGIGSPFIAVSAIQESYQQAREAIELGIRYHPEANSVIFDYGQVSLYDLIGCMATCKDRSAYGRELVEQISLYDRVNGTEFLKTLEVVLDFGGKRKDAASCLNIHPNTLDYRMRRLNEVVQCSLDDPGLRLAVHLWIKAIGCPRGVLEDTDGETS